ncbi:MAG: PAS domain-containing protein [Candidatus Synoicihabitans palmerolidicus]|nr:PAS domain-containing protein [Candidatus Synoicihabitans palmerolidicus]
MPDDISFKDLASRFIRINRSMLEQFGVESEADAMGKTDFDFCGVSHAAKAFTDEQTIIKTRAPVLDEEEHEIDSAGNTRWLTTTKMPRFDRKGDVVGIFGVSRDITSRKLEEADRQLAQKLESIGAMAAGIAHEINIPTQFITDNVKFGLDPFSELVAELPADIKERNNDMAFLLDKIPQALSQRLDGLERVGRIVSSRKQFAHPSAPESKPADLNAAIEATIQVFWHEWKYVAEMVCRLDEALPRVSCMIDQINQVVLNLVVNAAHVIEAANRETERERGRIEVRTRRLENEVMIEVEDDGSGIPASIQTRVFDPFFTTKEVRYGTGQGLAIAHKVVTEQHRGRIHFELEIGRGTTFHVRLPIAMQEGTEEV